MKKLLATGLALVLMVPVLVMADPGWSGRGDCDGSGPHRGMMQQKGMGRFNDGPGIGRVLALADEISLTDQQRADLKKMQLDFQTQMVDARAAVKKARISLRALTADNAAEADVTRKIDEVSKLEADLDKMRYRHHQAMKAVLTDEQKSKLEELCQERPTMKREFRKQRGGSGFGQG